MYNNDLVKILFWGYFKYFIFMEQEVFENGSLIWVALHFRIIVQTFL